MLKRKWTILNKPLEMEMDIACKVVHVCCALQNFLIAIKSYSVDDDDNTLIIDDEEEDDDEDQQAYFDYIAQLSSFDDRRAHYWRDQMAREMWNTYSERRR
ncbi:hypothetical protein AC1031_000121 [Aphanomyces cochlioides]|nr:hypothetical protein AC1031_000121 [Aphanomyces cochlioides]